MSRFSAPIAEQIWEMKYRLKDIDGTPLDGTVEDTWRRIARALAETEADPAAWKTGSTPRWRISNIFPPVGSPPGRARAGL